MDGRKYMAGLFGFFDGRKTGKKIENSHKQKRIVLFFAVYFRKFIRFVQLNMIYFLCTAPVLGVLAVYFAHAAHIPVDMSGTSLTTVGLVAVSYLPRLLFL